MIRSALRAYQRAFSGLPRDTWMLSLVLMINRSGSMVLPFIGLYLTQEHGISVAAAGRVLGIYGLGAVAGSWIGGTLADRIGATRTQHASLIASGVGFLWLGRLEGLVEISIGVFVLSIVVEAFRPAAMADLALRSPERLQVRAFALLRLAANVGMGIGPAVGGFLALHDYGWLFVADAATCWLASIAMLFTLGPAPSSPAEPVGASTAPERTPWRDGPFLLLLVLIVLVAAVFFQTMSTLPLYLRRDCALREDTIGLLLALNPALIVAFEMLLTHWAERRARLPLIGVGCFVLCAGFGMMPLGSGVAFLALTVAVWTFGEMLALPLANAVVAGRADARHRGRYMGLYAMAYSVAFVFAPTLGTWIYERFGATPLWMGIGLLGFVTGGMALGLAPAFRESGRIATPS